MNRPPHHSTTSLALTLLAVALSPAVAGTVAVKTGESIAFLGDSITQGGWEHPAGYVRLVISGLEANGIKATPIPAGISGHKSNDMLARVQRDVIDKKPAWMTLSCGVNDVWHGDNGVPLPQYQANITTLVDQCQAAGIKVMILTATVIGEQDNPENAKLAGYNEFLRRLAAEKKCLLADLNADMWAGLKAAAAPGSVFTVDGVHMNPAGDCLMATGVLRTFGLGEAQLAKAREEWLKIPQAAQVQAQRALTLGQFLKLHAAAERRRHPVQELLDEAFAADVEELAE